MTTIADSLQAGADALNNAVAQVLGLRTDLQAQIAAGLAQTQTVVANAITTLRVWYVDPVNGSDANDGSTLAKAKKTLDAVCVLAAPSTAHFVYLFGDLQHQRYTQLAATMTIRGSSPQTPSTDTFQYMPAKRTISFLPEAQNSPLGSGVRSTALIQFVQTLQFINCDIAIADVASGVNVVTNFIAANGSTLIIDNGNIYGTTPSNAGRLLGSGSSAPGGLFFRGTVASAAQGRIFAGVAAGADPNASKLYNSNLTTN